MERRAAKIMAPALLHGAFSELAQDSEGVDLLFWSGGKDSFLAARALLRDRDTSASCGRLLLLTTFDSGSRTVAHQEMPIATIVRQASALGVPLLGVPLSSHVPYEERVGEAIALAARECAVKRVCNGDLHLESVRAWRDARLKPTIDAIGAIAYAPLWNAPYERLLDDLIASGVPCTVCAIGDTSCWPNGEPCVAIGERFDAALADRLGRAGADRFGENGEFHTLAQVWAPERGVVHPLTDCATDGATDAGTGAHG